MHNDPLSNQMPQVPPAQPPQAPYPQPFYQPPPPPPQYQTPPASAAPQANYYGQPAPAATQPVPQPVQNNGYVSPAQRHVADIAPPPAVSPFAPQPSQPLPPRPYQPAQAIPQAPPQPLRPQLVSDIPVRAPSPNPGQAPPQPFRPPQSPPLNPFSTPGRPQPLGTESAEHGMDDILKDVNRNVAKTVAKQPGPLAKIARRLHPAKVKAAAAKVTAEPKPAAMVAMAALAFVSLAAAAFFAFSDNGPQGPSGPEVKVVGTAASAGDSIQAAGGTLVSPQEVEDLSDAMKKQIDGFNEAQDFNQDPLTDQALGL